MTTNNINKNPSFLVDHTPIDEVLFISLVDRDVVTIKTS